MDEPKKGEGTIVFGASDDLIEFRGDVYGESGYGGDDNSGSLVIFSDGTLLIVKYGKPGAGGIWGITVANKGSLFDRVDVCTDEDADPYSDVAYFKTGLKRAYVATDWERVK